MSLHMPLPCLVRVDRGQQRSPERSKKLGFREVAFEQREEEFTRCLYSRPGRISLIFNVLMTATFA